MAKIVSKVYGDALFLYAKDENLLEKTYEEAKDILDVLSVSNELKKFLYSPTISKEEKKSNINDLFLNKIWAANSPIAKIISLFSKSNVKKGEESKILNFINIMIDKDRERDLVDTLSYFLNKVREYKNVGLATVTTAFPLKENQKKALEEKLIKTTSYEQIIIDYKVDEKLICGMKIKIKDRVCDSSVQTKIEEISKNLRGVRV